MPSQRSLPWARACWRSGGNVFHCDPNWDSTCCCSGDRLDQATPGGGAAAGAAGGGGGCCPNDGAPAAIATATTVSANERQRSCLLVFIFIRYVLRCRSAAAAVAADAAAGAAEWWRRRGVSIGPPRGIPGSHRRAGRRCQEIRGSRDRAARPACGRRRREQRRSRAAAPPALPLSRKATSAGALGTGIGLVGRPLIEAGTRPVPSLHEVQCLGVREQVDVLDRRRASLEQGRLTHGGLPVPEHYPEQERSRHRTCGRHE